MARPPGARYPVRVASAAGQPLAHLIRHGLELGLPGQRGHDLRVQRLDDGAAVSGADDHIAGQQQANAPVGVQGPGRERRVAGAQDPVVLDLLAQFGPQRGVTSISVSTPNP